MRRGVRPPSLRQGRGTYNRPRKPRQPPASLSRPAALTAADPSFEDAISQAEAHEHEFSPLPQDDKLSLALDDAFEQVPEEALQESQVEGLIDLTNLEHRSDHGEEGPNADDLRQAAEHAERDPAIDEPEPAEYDEEESFELPIGAEGEAPIEHQINVQEQALQIASLSLEPSQVSVLDPPTGRGIVQISDRLVPAPPSFGGITMPSETPTIESLNLYEVLTKLIHFHQDKRIQIPAFHMAIGLLAHFNGMSRTDYAAFRDAVNLLRGADGNPVPEVENLPTQLTTLKNRVMRRLPLLDMREAQVPLRVDQIATETAARKRELQAAQQANPDSSLVTDTLMADQVTSTMRFFDHESLFKAFLSSSTGRQLHHGLGYFVDHAQELWHAPCWTSAIRTTSGHYTHIMYTDDDGEVKPSQPIFLGDFVYYVCEGSEGQCYCEHLETDDYEKAHLVRVSGVGKWYRDDPDHPWEDLLNQIVEGADGDGTAGSVTAWRKQAEESIVPVENERVLVDVFIAYISQENVAGFANVFLDWDFGEDQVDPSMPPQEARDLDRDRKGKKKALVIFPKYPDEDVDAFKTYPSDVDAVFDYIVKCYTKVATSNSLLMGRKPRLGDVDLETVVWRSRYAYRVLARAAAIAIKTSPHTKKDTVGDLTTAAAEVGADEDDPMADVESVGVGSRMATPVPGGFPMSRAGLRQGSEAPDVVASALPPPGAKYYWNSAQRPNIHLGLHWEMIARQYGAPVNLNVLPRENERRVAKTDVYTTNHSDVEKALLMKANVRQAARFALLGAFDSDDPVLTDNLQTLYQCCPNIFNSILTSTDDTAGQAEDEVAFASMALQMLSTSTQWSWVNCEQHTCERYFAPDVGLPFLNRDMSNAFKGHLRDACDRDYHLGKLYVWTPGPIQWYKCVRWATSERRQVSVSAGDYMGFHKTKVGRVDHIFTQDEGGERHIFVALTRLEGRLRRDPILESPPVRDDTLGPIIVGLPAVLPVHHYVIPIKDIGLVKFEWDIFTL
ncbi:hypothetical protein ACHAPT_000127 [Fusarium lateritium]